MNRIIKTAIIIVSVYVAIRLFIIIGGGIFEWAALMAPTDKSGTEQLNDGFHDAGEWFHEKSGRSDTEREKSMNAAGLYYNSETGRYEEDPERFARELDAKYGHNQ